MTPQTDIFGNTPKIGDTIVFNPPEYKGLMWGTCTGFSKSSGLPELVIDKTIFTNFRRDRKKGIYTPKTGFIIKGA